MNAPNQTYNQVLVNNSLSLVSAANLQAAAAVAEGIGTAAELKSVSDITPEQAAEYSALALGCSAMGAEVLEEYEFEPFFTALEPFLQGKKVVIFGS